MKQIALSFLLISLFISCKQEKKTDVNTNSRFNKLCEQYYDQSLKLNPIGATYIGDDRYNDLLPNDGSADYIAQVKSYTSQYLDSLNMYDRASLDDNNKLSYDVLKDQLETTLEGSKYHFEYLPFNQMGALPLTIGQLGSGTGAQPFKTVKDYDNWLKRVTAFTVWADTAIGNFRKGIAAGIVFPKSLVVKMYPQMLSMVVSDPKKSLFYGPVEKLPASFSTADKDRINADRAYL
jgi:uncharacterized protein (DUF885 family)